MSTFGQISRRNFRPQGDNFFPGSGSIAQGTFPYVIATNPIYGRGINFGDGAGDDTPTLQAAHDDLVAQGGGVLIVPRTSAHILMREAFIYSNQVRIVGEKAYGGVSTGGTMFYADPAGVFTNGPIADPYMFKSDGLRTAEPVQWWWHGGGFESIALDCNNLPIGGIHLWQPGENSVFERVSVNRTGSVNRTVADGTTDAAFPNVIHSPTAAFTDDDLNAFVTGDARIPADTKILQIDSATQVQVNNNIGLSFALTSLTIARPCDAVVCDGGAATGYIRSLNGINNLGALLRLTHQTEGSWVIESLSGDSNGGGLLRIDNASQNADPISITVVNFKAENYTQQNRMDPIFGLDKCDMVGLNIIGGSAVTNWTQDSIVKIIQSVTARGGPSVHLGGIEGNNPFNTGYSNILRDSTPATFAFTGIAAPALNAGFLEATPPIAPRLYPECFWGRDIVIGGGGSIRGAYTGGEDSVTFPGSSVQVTKTINHGLPTTPKSVLATAQPDGGAGSTIVVGNITPTTFDVTVALGMLEDEGSFLVNFVAGGSFFGNVNHKLGQTPTVVVASPVEDLPNDAIVSVGNFSATQFSISIKATFTATGTGHVCWRASIGSVEPGPVHFGWIAIP